MAHSVEPWLGGPLEGVPAIVMPVFFTFAQVREDLEKHVAGLTEEQTWQKPANAASVGFHIRHIGGSVDRLLTYLEGGELSAGQLASLARETEAGGDSKTLLAELDEGLTKAEARLKKLGAEDLFEPRYVGRKKLPTSVLGLIVHIAEHTQRHLGQAITTAKLVR